MSLTLPQSLLPALVLPLLQETFGGCNQIGKQQPIGRGRIVGRDRGGRRPLLKVGRNKPCRCGSGRKSKRCCERPARPSAGDCSVKRLPRQRTPRENAQ